MLLVLPLSAPESVPPLLPLLLLLLLLLVSARVSMPGMRAPHVFADVGDGDIDAVALRVPLLLGVAALGEGEGGGLPLADKLCVAVELPLAPKLREGEGALEGVTEPLREILGLGGVPVKAHAST